jgi:arylsulfatase
MPEFMASRDNRYEAMGSKQSLIFLGTNWALAAAAPYRLYKGVMTEGGTRVPAFVYGPVPAQRGAINGAYADVMDVAPTVLDLASVVVEPVVNGREVAPIRGRSMRPYLMGVSRQVHPDDQAIVIELHGQRAVRQGKWKLMLLPPPYGDSKWALYDLSLDPAELRDISAQFPERVRVLQEAWQRFAAETRLQP